MKLLDEKTLVISDVTPGALAQMWWGMSDVEQARFFNAVYDLTSNPDNVFVLDVQLSRLTDCPELTNGGRSIMRVIGDYS